MSVKSDVLLGPPQIAAKAAVDEGWLDDPGLNRLMGYGKGEIGCTKAVEDLRDALSDGNQEATLVGVYRGADPVGLFWVNYRGDRTRTAVLHFTASRKPNLRRAFHVAGKRLLDTLFTNGIYRVEVEPLRINKRIIKLLRHYGFKQEGIKRSAFWMDNNDYDTVLLRMLRREWTKKEG